MNNLFSWVGVLGAASAAILSAWAALRFAVLGKYRLNGETSKLLYDKIIKDATVKWVLSKEYVKRPKYPDIYEAFVVLNGIPFFFSNSERLLTAGWQGKDNVSTLTFLRWHREKVESVLNMHCSDSNTISLLLPHGPDLLGEIETDDQAQVYLNKGSYEDIEADVFRVVAGEIRKTSFLLHGLPGTGKTQFVKYLSKKYRLPINVVYFQPDFSNIDIIRMFAATPRNSIVLLEDFDTYFNNRDCLMDHDQVKFTFDSIINSLDGIHNDYRGVVFAMTANDIEKIDDSLKNRPSRFKFVRKFEKPDAETRCRILGNNHDPSETEDMTLDEVFKKFDSNQTSFWHAE